MTEMSTAVTMFFAFVFLNCSHRDKNKICSVEETHSPTKYGCFGYLRVSLQDAALTGDLWTGCVLEKK